VSQTKTLISKFNQLHNYAQGLLLTMYTEHFTKTHSLEEWGDAKFGKRCKMSAEKNGVSAMT
jgi:hypothetical protein